MKKVLGGVLVAGLMLGGAGAMAGEGKGHGMMRERMKARMAEVLRTEAGADDATIQRAQAVLESGKEEKQKARVRVKDAMKALRALVDSKSTDDAAYQKALDELHAARESMRALHERNREELSRVLTPRQRAVMAVAMEKGMKKRFGKRMHHGDLDE